MSNSYPIIFTTDVKAIKIHFNIDKNLQTYQMLITNRVILKDVLRL